MMHPTLTDSAAVQPERKSPSADGRPDVQRPELVLVVDDHDPSRYAVTRVLRPAGFRIVEAASGREALDLARVHRPALLILDVRLPDIMGWDVSRALKLDPATATMPILQVSSTYITDHDRAHGLDEGADGYLVHPIDPDVLLATVRALLRLRTAYEAVRRSDERLHTVLNSAPLILFAVDRDGRYTHLAGSRLNQLQVSPETILGQSVHALHADDQRFLANVKTALEGRTFADEVPFFGRWFEIQYNPLHDAHGRIDGFAAVATDITERKRAQEAREELLAIVAHDLRTPIATLKFDIELLKRALPGGRVDVSGEDVLRRMERSAGRAKRLIIDLLDHAKIESGTFTLDVVSRDLGPLLAEAVDIARPMALHKDVQIELEKHPPVALRCDGRRLVQALSNLLHNAVKFTPATGKIAVRLTDEAEQVVIAVVDNGAGIPEADLPRLFDRFWQGKTERAHGAGLGLAIAAGVVHAHGGKIWVESHLGAGSTFYMAFPK